MEAHNNNATHTNEHKHIFLSVFLSLVNVLLDRLSWEENPMTIVPGHTARICVFPSITFEHIVHTLCTYSYFWKLEGRRKRKRKLHCILLLYYSYSLNYNHSTIYNMVQLLLQVKYHKSYIMIVSSTVSQAASHLKLVFSSISPGKYNSSTYWNGSSSQAKEQTIQMKCFYIRKYPYFASNSLFPPPTPPLLRKTFGYFFSFT